MSTFLPFYPVLAIATVLAACATAAGVNAIANAAIPMAQQQRVALTGDVFLRYDAAHDSRCPPAVRCIWAGKIGYQFTLGTSHGDESFELSSEHTVFASSALPGVTIALADATIPPIASAGPYPLVVSIRTHASPR